MATNLELLRRLVRQQTNLIGNTVPNLLGPVPRQVAPLRAQTAESSMLLLELPGLLPVTDLEAFYVRFGLSAERVSRVVTTSEGVLVVAHPETRIWVFRGTIDVVDSMTLPLTMATGASNTSYAVYVDGVVVRRGTGDRELPLRLGQGRHTLEVLVTGTSFGLVIPPGTVVQAVRDTLNAPSWSSVSTGYADATAGTPATTLRWFNDPRAGGWIVMRRQLETFGQILNIGIPGPTRVVGLTIAGDATAGVVPGSTVHAGFEALGQALDVVYEAATVFTTNLLDNPALTTVSTGWTTAAASASRVTGVANPAEAAAVYRVTTTNVGSSGAVIQRTGGRFTAVADTEYAPSVFLNGDNAAGKTFNLAVTWYTAGGSTISTTTLGPFLLVPGWQRLSARATAPATAATATLSVYTASAQGVFTVDMTGAQVCETRPGSVIPPYAAAESVTGVTFVRLQLASDQLEPDPAWYGRSAGAGTFHEVNRIQRADSSPIIRWADLDVTLGGAYEYVLQSYGLFDATVLSPLSDVVYVRAGDATPPGSITLHPGYPQVVNRRASVSFTTPADDDYAGTRVYFEDVAQIGTSPGGGADHQFVLASAPAVDVTGYLLEITAGAGAGQQQRIASVAGVTCTMQPWATKPTSSSQYRVYRMLEVVTDFGKPDTRDQLAFDVVLTGGVSRYGRYVFVTFDHAGNEQRFEDAVTWDFTSAADAFIGAEQPPVVAARQLTAAEQVTLVAPYNDTKNYAVLEVSASDPVNGTTGVIIEYRLRGGDSGTANSPSGSMSLLDTDKTWTINQWGGYLVELLSGTGAGQARQVTSNGVNLLAVTPAWTTVPDATTTYRLVWITGLPATANASGVDDPRGVRSRLIAVTRQDTANWVDIRAKDANGLVSTTVSYTPDFDWSPEIGSVETRLEPVTGRVFVNGTADDDCRSLEWWVTPAGAGEPTSASPALIADLSAAKAFAFDFALPDGGRKRLTLRPFAGVNATGTEGIDVIREFARSPRSTLLLEPRTGAGAVSSTVVRATTTMSPLPTTLVTGTVTSATSTTLTDTSKSWLGGTGTGDGQFERVTSTYRQFYVEITGGSNEAAVGQVRPIIRNTNNQLILEIPWSVVPNATNTYAIRDGAVWFRKLASEIDVTTPFIPTSGVEFITRNSAEQYVEHYAALSGTTPEPVQRGFIDQDELPEIYSVTVVEDPAGWLQVTLGGYDDDTKRWRLYARKGAYPVKLPDGTTTTVAATAQSPEAQLDPTYLRADMPITHGKTVSFTAGAGTWYLVIVGVSSYEELGPRVTAQRAVINAQDTAGRLSNARVERDNGGGLAYNLVRWDHNTTIASPVTGWSVRVWTYRQDLGVASQVELTSPAGQNPWADVYTDAANTQGSIRHQVPNAISSGGAGPTRTWVYTIKLYQGATERQTLQTTFTTTYEEELVPTFTPPVLVSLRNSGTCSIGA